MLKFQWPQIVYIVLVSLSLLTGAHNHGKVQGPHNFWVVLAGTIIGAILLYFGGFFTQ